jgi:hypothetical protein
VRKKVKIPHVIDSTKLAQPRVRMVEKAIEGVTGLREQLEPSIGVRTRQEETRAQIR